MCVLISYSRHNAAKQSMYGYHPAVPVKDLMTFDKNSLINSSMVATLPIDGGRIVASQDYKSLQI